MSWQENIRLLWTDHLVWIRQLLISLMFRLRDLSYVTIRALQNAIDFSAQLTPFYGVENVKLYETLLVERVLLLAELASTIKMSGDITVQMSKLHTNADDTAALFSSLNPYWNKATWQGMLYLQYELEEQLIRQIAEDKFSTSISIYDAIYQNALKMASYMIDGITAQFPQYAYPAGTALVYPTGPSSTAD
ncbi:MAG TPA: hypothetical protein VM577_09675 [Anaerovoracaceae bacterium]|nr:hypothetical protein [Anaerovoracaceae bacterium]